MTKKRQYKHFSLEVLTDKTEKSGVRRVELKARDKYSRRRYAIERQGVTLFANGLQRYLTKRPHKNHESKRNLARRLTYLTPAMRAWANYMPGGFATYHVHNPERLQIKNGKKLDLITKNLFRHSYDGQGLRSRSYAMAWWLHEHLHEKTNGIRWASIACGTGQPTFDASSIFVHPTHYLLIDSDTKALDFAQKLAESYDIDKSQLTVRELNVIKQRDDLTDELQLFAPDCIDAMGLLEYLTDEDAVELLAHLYEQLPKGGLLVFTNMLHTHPHLDVHKRALCWPGVNVREEKEVLALLKKAGVPADTTTILLPDDGVYGVYGVRK